MKSLSKSKGGFTIIEVVLVLAIAGLIFLIVFLAVPALQRSQRDTQRKSDLSRFMSQINSFQSNSRGVIPVASIATIETAPNGFVPTYLNVGGDTFEDPKGSPYLYSYGAGSPAAITTTPPNTVATIRYATSARCGANGAITATGTSRQAAASISLEGGGAFCQQN